MTAKERALTRREPKQERSRQTVEAVLDAVARVLKRQGVEAITTNRIAEAAGVSIGSLYQYFPDKRAIFTALYDRHIDEVGQLIERTKADCASASFEDFTRELVEGLARLHADDAELHQLISGTAPEGTLGFKSALQTTFEQVISRAEQDRYTPEESSRLLFVLPNLVEALVHAVADHNRPVISRTAAKDEAIRTVLVYLNSLQPSSTSRASCF